MKKVLINDIVITACIALYAAVWLRSSEDEKVPAEPVKLAMNAEIEAKPEESTQAIFPADTPASELELL